MKRPMLWLAICYIAGILAGQYFPKTGGIALFAVASVFSAAVVCRKTKSKGPWLLAVAALMGLISIQSAYPVKNREIQTMARNQVEVRVTGVVSDRSRSRSGRMMLTVKGRRVQAENLDYTETLKFTVLLPEEAETPDLGSEVVLWGDLYLFSEPRNPGDFHFARYYRARGFDYGVYAERIESASPGGGFHLASLRERIQEIYDACLPEEEAGILKAMVVGDKSGVDETMQEQYRKAGISHVLAISGLHVTLMGYLVLFVLEKLFRCPPRLSAGIAIGFLWAYGLFTGMSASTARAVILGTMTLSARLFYRNAEVLNSLGLAALLLLGYEPLYLWDVGFQLSFASVLGIVLGFRWLDGFTDRRPPVLDLALTTVFASLGSYPLVAYYFYRISVVSLAANLVVVPALELVLGLGILVGVVGLFAMPAALFFSGPVYLLLHGCGMLSAFLAKLPFAEIHLGRPAVLLILLYYGFLLCVYCFRDERRTRAAYLALAVVFCFTAAGNRLFFHNNTVAFLDVGQGDSAVISTYDGKVAVIDGGGSTYAAFGDSTGKNVVYPYLDYLGADKIDLLFLSHMDTDHAKGALELLELMPVDRVVIGRCSEKGGALYIKLMELVERKDIPLYTIKTGDSIPLTASLALTCLYAGEENISGDTNGDSLVLKLTEGDHGILFTGDLEAVGAELLLGRGAEIGCDVLKLPHHGSRNSSGHAFLTATGADYGVISAGEGNVYGHPHAETLERLEEAGITPLVTAQQGAVIFYINEKEIKR